LLDETNPGGRPSKLTIDVQSKICAALQRGNYIETSAAFAGVSKSVLFAWMKQGNADRDDGKANKYTRFLDAVEIAQAEAEVRDLQHIDKHGETSWQAAAWKLERRFPKRWGRVNPDQEVGEKGQGAGITIQIGRISDEPVTN
jgi:hypothetical protein